MLVVHCMVRPDVDLYERVSALCHIETALVIMLVHVFLLAYRASMVDVA